MIISAGPATEKTGHAQILDSPIFPYLLRAADLQKDRFSCREEPGGFALPLKSLRGRLVELSSSRPSACLSSSCSLLLEAQQNSASVVWISITRDHFYPPDLAANGVDLSVLPVFWAPDIRGAIQAADQLARTGAFGLLVIDLYRNARLPASLQVRLACLAQQNGCAVCFLTVKPETAASLGSMISLYARVSRNRGEPPPASIIA